MLRDERGTARADAATDAGALGHVTVAHDIDFAALRSLREKHGAIYPRGRAIFRQQDLSCEFYVILQGSVELSVRDPVTGGQRVLRVLGPGEFFGEMACFSGQPRTASAIARDDVFLLIFTQQTAMALLQASPRFALGIIQTLCDRVRTYTDLFVRHELAPSDNKKK